jgi:hypothetical protein
MVLGTNARDWYIIPLARIGKLYEIEAGIRGQPPDVRRAVRQLRSRPLVEELHLCWCGRPPTASMCQNDDALRLVVPPRSEAMNCARCCGGTQRHGYSTITVAASQLRHFTVLPRCRVNRRRPC